MRTIVAILLAAVGALALGALYLWIGLDATLEGDAMTYAQEPVEHCPLHE